MVSFTETVPIFVFVSQSELQQVIIALCIPRYETNDDSGCPLYGYTGAIGNCCHCGDSKRSFDDLGELWEAFVDGVSELFGAFTVSC